MAGISKVSPTTPFQTLVTRKTTLRGGCGSTVVDGSVWALCISTIVPRKTRSALPRASLALTGRQLHACATSTKTRNTIANFTLLIDTRTTASESTKWITFPNRRFHSSSTLGADARIGTSSVSDGDFDNQNRYFFWASSADNTLSIGGPPPCISPCGNVKSHSRRSVGSRYRLSQPSSLTAIRVRYVRVRSSILLATASARVLPPMLSHRPRSFVSSGPICTRTEYLTRTDEMRRPVSRRDAVRSQVIDVLEAQIKRRPA